LNAGTDCDGDGVLDVCQGGTQDDCDGNGTPDVCDILETPSLDCDMNGALDACQLESDPELLDCDADGQLDVCQLANDPEADCDGNGVLDVCQIPSGATEGSDWMVQQFLNGVDVIGLGVRLVPRANGPPHWDLCTVGAGSVWLDPTDHTQIALGDDDAASIAMPYPFPFGGNAYQQASVGSNGYVTFGIDDTTYAESLAAQFSLPRVSALFDDLDPSVGGSVLHGTGPAGSFVVSWVDVPEYQVTGSSNTLQLVLHPDGVIEMSWPSLTAHSGIAGPSFGGGIPEPFAQTDLSNAFDCVARPVAPIGDCNNNGVPDVCEAVPVGDPFWATEHYLGDFDLGYQQVSFTPSGGSEPPVWQVCSQPVSGLPYDTIGGQVVPLGDDDAQLVPLGFSFSFGGSVWNDVFVNSNGNLTFGTADYSYGFTPWSHFIHSRISGLFSDLRPDLAGAVTVDWPTLGLFVVTWEDVPFWEPDIGDADFQIVLHQSGQIEMAWLNITPPECLVGLSDGMYVPSGFAETDLSATGSSCQLVQPFNDCDGDGVHDGIQIALGCEYDYEGDGILDICQGSIGALTGACATEVTGDGLVDVRDLLAVLMAWGDVKPQGQNRRCDFGPGKGDFRVDLFDLMEVIAEMHSGCDGQP
jgi:hypothetical protein